MHEKLAELAEERAESAARLDAWRAMQTAATDADLNAERARADEQLRHDVDVAMNSWRERIESRIRQLKYGENDFNSVNCAPAKAEPVAMAFGRCFYDF